MVSTAVPSGALSTVGMRMGERFLIYPTPLSTMTSRMATPVPYAPLQSPTSVTGSTISGFELDEDSHASTPASGHHTPGASSVICAAMEARIEQLLEENDVLAQELRDLHYQNAERKERRKQNKQRKKKERQAKLETDIFREILRFATAVLMPLPEGSPGRFVIMAVEAFWLRDKVPAPA